MEKKFELSNKSRIIGKLMNSSMYIVTNDSKATINDIFALGAIMDGTGKVLSPEMPIGIFTKSGYWEIFDPEVEKKKLIVKSSVLGFAVGDAFGVPVEFLSRNEIRKLKINKMLGNGSHNVPAGSWSDDTSMIVATMDSIIRSNGEIDYEDIMKCFCDWLANAKYTSLDFTFGVGNIIFRSLIKFSKGIPALECGEKEFMDNGNGSLMRILPISLYCILNNLSEEETIEIVNNASKITHAHDISKMSCYIFTEFLRKIIETNDKKNAFQHILKLNYDKYYSEEAIGAYKQLLDVNFPSIDDVQIKESGYVVDTLESVIYSILNTETYVDAVTMAVNLGYDTDTVAGITGAIAGVIYGYDKIPKEWLTILKKRSYLEKISEKFYKSITECKKEKNQTL